MSILKTIYVLTLGVLICFTASRGLGAEDSSLATTKESVRNVVIKDDAALLDFYRQQSEFTDPGEYAYLYESLPESLSELCSLIRMQFVNPYVHRNKIPRERLMEGSKYPTVELILEGLLSYDASGLVKSRKFEDRLVLICRENSILLASILRHRGIPTRVRSGHATYLIPGRYASHTLCEVWNKDEERWMLVDPSTDMVDLPEGKFVFAWDSWLMLQSKEVDPSLYAMPGRYSGLVSITGKVYHDCASVLGSEYTAYQYAPILGQLRKNNDQMTTEDIKLLTQVSKLMQSVNAGRFSQLQQIYKENPRIQVTESFNPSRKRQ
ncbi:transglutaminase domain-containing protein [Planctomycetota bacterium]